MENLARVRDFVKSFTRLVDQQPSEERVFKEGRAMLSELIRHDDWLPEPFAKPDPARYQQYLLYCDPMERFSVASFVWGPGQKTPVHDHTVWGVIGMLRGGERCVAYRDAGGKMVPAGEEVELEPGDVEMVSPNIGDVHTVRNAYDDRVSISIHAYGANIGKVRRHVFDPQSGAVKEFVSGYSNA